MVALKNEFGEYGRKLAHLYSYGADGLRYDMLGVETTWDGLNGTHRNPMTFGTIVFLARQVDANQADVCYQELAVLRNNHTANNLFFDSCGQQEKTRGMLEKSEFKRNLCYALRGNLPEDEALQHFQKFCKLLGEKNDVDEHDDLWNRYDDPTAQNQPVSVEEFKRQFLAGLNQKEQSAFASKLKKATTEAERNQKKVERTTRPDVMSGDVENDYDAAMIAYKHLKGRIVFCQGVVYFRKGNVWENDPKRMESCIMTEIQSSDIRRMGKDKSLPYAQNFGTATKIKNTLMNYIINQGETVDFNNKLHNTTKDGD